MSLKIHRTTRPEDAAEFVGGEILRELNAGKRVLFFATGGSGISVGGKTAEMLRAEASEEVLKNLTITLTDERYGPVGHPDSNWQQLMEKGFMLPGAKLIPVLTGDSREITAENFNKNLEEEFQNADYKIGLFGIGKDGHTSGILPESIAIDSADLVASYDTPQFSRITTTPKAIEKLDEAVVWAQGEDKWPTLQDLEKDIDVAIQPAQILKKIPSVTIFTDYTAA